MATEATTHRDPPWLDDLLDALGWQGGTIHQALDHVRDLANAHPYPYGEYYAVKEGSAVTIKGHWQFVVERYLIAEHPQGWYWSSAHGHEGEPDPRTRYAVIDRSTNATAMKVSARWYEPGRGDEAIPLAIFRSLLSDGNPKWRVRRA